jgi:hypothetical protein
MVECGQPNFTARNRNAKTSMPGAAVVWQQAAQQD